MSHNILMLRVYTTTNESDKKKEEREGKSINEIGKEYSSIARTRLK